MLNPEQELVSVKYFSALVGSFKGDTSRTDRQRFYLEALSTNPLTTFIEHTFLHSFSFCNSTKLIFAPPFAGLYPNTAKLRFALRQHPRVAENKF